MTSTVISPLSPSRDDDESHAVVAESTLSYLAIELIEVIASASTSPSPSPPPSLSSSSSLPSPPSSPSTSSSPPSSPSPSPSPSPFSSLDNDALMKVERIGFRVGQRLAEK